MVRLSKFVAVAIVSSFVLTGVALAAYLVDTITHTVEVEENIVILTPLTSSATMYPGESGEVEVILKNIGSVAQDVEISASVLPVASV